MTDDELRARILELNPELRLDVKVLTDIFRKQVDLERDKLGYNHHTGSLDLQRVNEKPSENAPDLLGTGRVAGVSYDVAGWIKGDTLHVVLRQPLRKSQP